MENDNVTVILLTVLIVSAFLPIVFKLAEFFSGFNQVRRYILMGMRRAEDHNEYLYWRRELHCHYLCLIPFVNERNAMDLYNRLFHRPQHYKKVKNNDGIMRILAPSVISICICAVCLCGVSWAWFTSSSSTVTTEIKTPNYSLAVYVTDSKNNFVGSSADIEYLLADETYTVKLTATGTENATGYCSVKIGNDTYYTEQINAVSIFTFTVKANGSTTITLTPKWGTYAIKTNDNLITSGKEIAVDGESENKSTVSSTTGSLSEPAKSEASQPTAPQKTPARTESSDTTVSTTSTVTSSEATKQDETASVPTEDTESSPSTAESSSSSKELTKVIEN